MAFRTALVVLSALSASLAMPAAPALDAEIDTSVETANITERAPGCTVRAYIHPTSLQCPGDGSYHWDNYGGGCISYNGNTPMYAIDIENFVTKGCKRQSLHVFYDSFECKRHNWQSLPAKRCSTPGKPFRSFKVYCVDPLGPVENIP